jgi:hypothetical protein
VALRRACGRRSPRPVRQERELLAVISFFCPFCKMPLKADAEQANHLIECVQCKLEVRVPPPPTVQVKPSAASLSPPDVAHAEPWPGTANEVARSG